MRMTTNLFHIQMLEVLMNSGMCFQLECFPRLREETERIVTAHIRDRESRAKDQVKNQEVRTIYQENGSGFITEAFPKTESNEVNYTDSLLF